MHETSEGCVGEGSVIQRIPEDIPNVTGGSIAVTVGEHCAMAVVSTLYYET